MSPSVPIYKKKKDILILRKEPTVGLDDIKLQMLNIILICRDHKENFN